LSKTGDARRPLFQVKVRNKRQVIGRPPGIDRSYGPDAYQSIERRGIDPVEC
jgi:hypothetical protein